MWRLGQALRRFFAAKVTKEGMWIMMPYLDGGSLREHLDSCEKKAEETDPQWQNTHFTDPCSRYYLLAVFYQVLQGVQSMHQKSIVHMDIKPDNIMLHQKSAFRVAQTYLVDLGLACFVGTCRFSGTPGFMPPELWDRKEPTAAYDMWALGVTLYNIVYRDSPPFYGDMDGKATRAFVPAEEPEIWCCHLFRVDVVALGMVFGALKHRKGRLCCGMSTAGHEHQAWQREKAYPIKEDPICLPPDHAGHACCPDATWWT